MLEITQKGLIGFDLIKTLSKLAEKEDGFFRRVIPHAYSTIEEKEAYATLFTQKLLSLIEKYGTNQLLEKQQEYFVGKQTLSHRGKLADALALEKLNLDTTVSKRKGFKYFVENAGNGTAITFTGQKISLPKFIEKEIFLQGASFKVRDIKGLVTDKSKIELVQELIKTGFLQIEDNYNLAAIDVVD